MRSIARTCGIELALIQYHFVDKLTLWRATLDNVVGEFRMRWARTLARLQGRSPDVILAQFVECLVRHAAANPAFVAIMSHARLQDSPNVKVFQDQLRGDSLVIMEMIETAQNDGAFVVGRPEILFYQLVGAALRIFMMASDAKALGVDLQDTATLEDHVSLCLRLFMPTAGALRTSARAKHLVRSQADSLRPTPETPDILSDGSSPVGPSTFYLLTNTDSVVRKNLDQELRALGITAAQMIALVRIADEHRLSSARLARMLDVSAQTVTLFVRSLENQGLILRRQAPSSRRVLEIELTSAGVRVLEQLRKVVAACEQRLLDGLSSEERHALRDLLTRILQRHRPLALKEYSPLLGRVSRPNIS